MQKLVKMAKAGDVRAASVIFDRLLGKPRASVDLSHTGSISLSEIIVAETEDEG